MTGTSNNTMNNVGNAAGWVPDISARIVEFAHVLRQNQYSASIDDINLAHQAARVLDLQNVHAIRKGFKACFCQNAKEWQQFDKLFYAFWFHGSETVESTEPVNPVPNEVRSGGLKRLLGLAGTSSEKQHEMGVFGSGDYSALSLADFRFVFDPKEKAIVERYVDELAQRARRRFTRKKRLVSHGQRIAMRQSLRCCLRYQGRIMRLQYHKQQTRLPSFVLLLDISQSMDVYAKLFLRFTRKLAAVFDDSHAFAFNTKLIYLGKGHAGLEEGDFENAINAASHGWVGGTRIATSFKSFNEDYLQIVVKSQSTVVVFSDGYDTDPPEQLAIEMDRIARQSRRVVWVNPLLGRSSGKKKDERMDALAPYVDHYVSSHNLQSLEALQKILLSQAR